MNDKSTLMEFLKLRFPQVLEKTEIQTRQAEQLRIKNQPPDFTGFLWEHSLRVSQIAYELTSQIEFEDVETVVLAALLHDAGKFSGGDFGSSDIREEEASAEKAEEILISSGLSKKLVLKIKQTISNLYSGKRFSKATAIIHDADRLDKAGMIGLANFFQKWTLRGLKLADIVEQKIGPELTYLANLRASLKTSVAQKHLSDVKESVEIFKNLVSEYSRAIENKLSIKCYDFEGKEIYSVKRANCSCGGSFSTNLSKATSIKCELVLVEHTCLDCGSSQSSSICFSRL